MEEETNDNQQGVEENADNIEELRVEDAATDIDFEKAFDTNAGDTNDAEDEADGLDDISAEDAFAAEAGARVALQQQVGDLQAQLEDRTGQFTRLTADFDNFRKRTEKQR
ncbi:MAG: nucleotide exchange factor GrpE, partial [Cyanobacteria bacterium J06631_9]